MLRTPYNLIDIQQNDLGKEVRFLCGRELVVLIETNSEMDQTTIGDDNIHKRSRRGLLSGGKEKQGLLGNVLAADGGGEDVGEVEGKVESGKGLVGSLLSNEGEVESGKGLIGGLGLGLGADDGVVGVLVGDVVKPLRSLDVALDLVNLDIGLSNGETEAEEGLFFIPSMYLTFFFFFIEAAIMISFFLQYLENCFSSGMINAIVRLLWLHH